MNGTSRLASGWCRYPIGYGEPQNDQIKNHRQHLVAPKKPPESRSESIGQLLVCLLALRGRFGT
jgi:hypothetical protein